RFRKKLERDEAAQFGIFGLVDHAHPTPTEFFEDAEMRDGPALEGLGVGHSATWYELSREKSTRAARDVAQRTNRPILLRCTSLSNIVKSKIFRTVEQRWQRVFAQTC